MKFLSPRLRYSVIIPCRIALRRRGSAAKLTAGARVDILGKEIID